MWCKHNEMIVNESKSKVIHFRTQSTQCTEVKFICGNAELENAKQYVYLGLVLTVFLDYSVMAKHVANSAGRALGLDISKFKSARSLPFSTFTKLFDSTVWRIIDYGASVWGCRTFSCISAVQNQALRLYLGVGRYTPNSAVSGDTGWKSTYLKQLKNITNQWCKLKSMDRQRIKYKICAWSVENCAARGKNWAPRVKAILLDANQEHYFLMNTANCSVQLT